MPLLHSCSADEWDWVISPDGDDQPVHLSSFHLAAIVESALKLDYLKLHDFDVSDVMLARLVLYKADLTYRLNKPATGSPGH